MITLTVIVIVAPTDCYDEDD